MSSAVHSLPNAFFVIARAESSYLEHDNLKDEMEWIKELVGATNQRCEQYYFIEKLSKENSKKGLRKKKTKEKY